MLKQIAVSVPRLEYFRVQNYRVLENLELRDVRPLTAFLGPNGSGKSTVFDALGFLSECFTTGLRRAWDKRGRFKELRTRNKSGPIIFELRFRESSKYPIITYHISIDEDSNGPFVSEEWLQWRRGSHGKPFQFLIFRKGVGEVISGDLPEEHDDRVPEKLSSREILAVSTLGQLAKHPRVSALRQFISSWYLSYLSADSTHGVRDVGPQEHLSHSGDNLPNMMQYLKENHSDVLESTLQALRSRIPSLETIETQIMPDGRLLLQLKDAPFGEPILSRYASEGTLKLLSYLTVLFDPDPPQLIGIEEPENQLHPRLLLGLCEECRKSTVRTQLFVTTHSPEFVDGLRADELWVLSRDIYGFTQAKRANDIELVSAMMNNGAKLGELWMEGYFPVGDPLINSGMSTTLSAKQPRIWG